MIVGRRRKEHRRAGARWMNCAPARVFEACARLETRAIKMRLGGEPRQARRSRYCQHRKALRVRQSPEGFLGARFGKLDFPANFLRVGSPKKKGLHEKEGDHECRRPAAAAGGSRRRRGSGNSAARLRQHRGIDTAAEVGRQRAAGDRRREKAGRRQEAGGRRAEDGSGGRLRRAAAGENRRRAAAEI